MSDSSLRTNEYPEETGRGKKKSYWMRVIPVFLSLFLLFALPGCNTVFDWHFSQRTVAECGNAVLTDKDFRILALEYKCLYENYYKDLLSESFWVMEVSPGRSFETYVKENCLLRDAESLLYLTQIAEKENILLTFDEEERVENAAAAFFSALTEDEKRYINANPDDVRSLLRRFYVAYNAEQFLLKDKACEVSDEASRVLDLEVLHTETEADARALKERLNKGEIFRTVAMENTIDERLLYSVCREDLMEPFRTEIFNLSSGEVSDVIVYENEGYIFRIAASYNLLLSQNNKSNMLAKLRYENWKDAYSAYNIKEEPAVNHAFLKKLDLTRDGDFPYVSLFKGLISD